MEATERFTEVVDVLADMAPLAANGTVGIHNSGYVNLADYHRAFVWLHVGVPGGASTIDVRLMEATDAAGTGAQAIAGKAITTIVAADTGVHVGIELRPEELTVTNGYAFVNAEVTVGVNTYTYSLVIFGLTSRYEPVGVADFAEIIP